MAIQTHPLNMLKSALEATSNFGRKQRKPAGSARSPFTVRLPCLEFTLTAVNETRQGIR